MARMGDSRLPKQLLFSNMQKAELSAGKTGRPIKGWIEYVREDMIELKIAFQ